MDREARNDDIETILWQIRSEDPSTYFAIVNMHLSFVTEQETDQCDGKLDNTKAGFNKWNLTPLLKRFSRTSKRSSEGTPLTEEGVCQAYQLTSYLRKSENRRLEGLFRKAGSHSRQSELKRILSSSLSVNLENGTYTAHDCASVLKSFLADLPEPLLQEECYHVHCRIAAMYSKSMSEECTQHTEMKQVNALQLAFLLLPPPNYKLLKDLLLLLHDVAQEEKFNKMSSSNLGTMFAPHILFPRRLPPSELQDLSGVLRTAVAFMIDHATSLFQIPPQLEADLRGYWRNRKTLPKDGTTQTLYSFVDQKKSAEANSEDVTSLALAELYAYVQSLPDSTQKEKLIKKFNEANGPGTPQMSSQSRGKSLGNSIKKHLFSKSIKSKNLFMSGGLKNKRSSSTEVLSPPSCCSPELRFFRKTPSRSKSKSLDELTVIQSSEMCVTVFEDEVDATPSDVPEPTAPCENQGTPLSSKALFQKTEGLPTKKKMKFSHSYGAAASSTSPLKDAKPMISSLPELQLYNCDGNSPISMAVNSSHLQQATRISTSDPKDLDYFQKVMLTPRCRQPIVMNSMTSLSAINNLESGDEKQESSDSQKPQTLKESSSSVSLLGGFFKHLSTTSLMQLATKLTRNNSDLGEEMLSPCLEVLSPCAEKSTENLEGSHNDSLSFVFKEYILGRSLLTDNPVDLSTPGLDASGQKENLTPVEQQKTVDYTLNNEESLSESLVYCLDGHDPMDEFGLHQNDMVSSTPLHPVTQNELNTCTPTGRNKLFKNKQGTPIPAKDLIENVSDPAQIAFETSL